MVRWGSVDASRDRSGDAEVPGRCMAMLAVWAFGVAPRGGPHGAATLAPGGYLLLEISGCMALYVT